MLTPHGLRAGFGRGARVLRAVHREESGQALIGAALAVVFVLIMFALALDVGFWFFDHRLAQNQADAAAHAAALELTPGAAPVAGGEPSTAVARAQEWLTRNGATPTSTCAPDPPGQLYSGMIFWDDDGDGSFDTVRVCVRRESAIILSALVNLEQVMISASGKATWLRIPLRYALMAMHPTTCRSLEVSGNPTVRITGGGGSFTNSTCAASNQGALRVGGNAALYGAMHDVVGTAYDGNILEPSATTGVSDRPDPFRDVAPPAIPATCTTNGVNINSGSTVLPAGRHCGTVSIQSTANVTVEPGVHIFHQGLSVQGSATFTSGGQEVLLYGTCPISPCNGTTTNIITFAGGVTTDLRGHSDYANILIFVDRTAGATSEVRITGGSGQQVSGSVYNIAGVVNLSGGSSGETTLNISVVASEIDIGGGATLNMPWDPQTAPSERFPALVE